MGKGRLVLCLPRLHRTKGLAAFLEVLEGGNWGKGGPLLVYSGGPRPCHEHLIPSGFSPACPLVLILNIGSLWPEESRQSPV